MNHQKNQFNSLVRWADIYPYLKRIWSDMGGSLLPSGTDSQTLRHDGSAWEVTSDLKSHSDGTGASIAVDNDTEQAERIRNIVKVQEGNTYPDASDTYQGTILVIHKAS